MQQARVFPKAESAEQAKEPYAAWVTYWHKHVSKSTAHLECDFDAIIPSLQLEGLASQWVRKTFLVERAHRQMCHK